MVARKDKIVSELVSGIGHLFKSHAVTQISGVGKFKDRNHLLVEDVDGKETIIEAGKIIIATGSRPLNIPAFPFDGETVVSSNELINLPKIPQSITIIGGGVIGCEFACLLCELGSTVTIVEMLPHLLPLEDIDTSKTMEREMKKKRVKLFLGQKVESVETGTDGAVAKLQSGENISSEQVLVSIGRSFNTENINIEAVGCVLNKNGSIAVDDHMETSVPGVYAIGDCAGKYLLAYTASYEGTVAVSNALGKVMVVDYTGVPSAVFTDPEVGSVGLTQRQAEEAGYELAIGQYLFRSLGKSKAEREISGAVKMIANKKDDQILGVHIVGAHATDLIHEAAIAIRQGMTASELGNSIHAHPVLSEAIMEAAHDVHGLSVHTPKKRV